MRPQVYDGRLGDCGRSEYPEHTVRLPEDVVHRQAVVLGLRLRSGAHVRCRARPCHHQPIVKNDRFDMDGRQGLAALETMNKAIRNCGMQDLKWKKALPSFPAGEIGMVFRSTSTLGAVERALCGLGSKTGSIPGMNGPLRGLPAGGNTASVSPTRSIRRTSSQPGRGLRAPPPGRARRRRHGPPAACQPARPRTGASCPASTGRTRTPGRRSTGFRCCGTGRPVRVTRASPSRR